jgi:tRNA A-37 threonylcarbamoyl transferase component Bud32
VSTSAQTGISSLEPDSGTVERPSSVVPASDVRRAALASEAYDLAVGDLIGGKFRVERIIGEGGMGLVVAATHLGLDERVALKFLHPNAGRNPEAIARFFQEAKAAAKLKSEHVAHVLDVSQRQDGCPFIVMEFLRGSDLRYVLGLDGPLAVETVADYMIQACEGLAEAHARGIVHRDIKPENLFLTERSQGWRIVKILDFGISKAMIASSTLSDANIRTGAIMGSPSYMSPEQLRETSSVDHRTDLWALGAVMYELLTGSPAFDSSKPLTGLILDILQVEPPLAHTRHPHIPPELSAVVARCLAKNREDRFATAADLALALLPFAPSRARVAAQRAVAITKEAGGVAAQMLAMPLSVPPMYSRGAGLAKTALALDVVMPPISSRQVVTRSAVVAEIGRAARAPSWSHVALVGIAAVALVAVVAIGQWAAPSGYRPSIARDRALAHHVLASPMEGRSAVDVDRAIPAAIVPVRVLPPHPSAPSPAPSPVVDASLEIVGAR